MKKGLRLAELMALGQVIRQLQSLPDEEGIETLPQFRPRGFTLAEVAVTP